MLAAKGLGDGPLYCFYEPYHLCHLDAPMSLARAVLFGDAVGQPLGGPVVEVVAIAKRALEAGETLDSFGRYMTYGQSEQASVVRAEGLVCQKVWWRAAACSGPSPRISRSAGAMWTLPAMSWPTSSTPSSSGCPWL